MAEVGSSSSSTGGSWNRARARASFWRMPFEYSPMRRLRSADSPNCSSSSAARWRRWAVGMPYSCPKNSRYSSAGMRPYSPCCSVSTPTAPRTCCGCCTTSKPATRALPAAGQQHRGQHAHGGGLARPVGAEQRHHLAGLHRQVNAIHGDEAVKVLAQILGFDHTCALSTFRKRV